MEEKDLQVILDKVTSASKEAITSQIEDVKKGLMTPGQFADGIKGLANADTVKALAESVEQLAVDIKKMRKGEVSEKAISEMLIDQKEALQAIANGRKDVSVKLDMKTAVVTGTSWTDSRQAIRKPGVNEPAHRLPLIPALFSQMGIDANSGGAIRYVDVTTATRNAAARSENIAAAESAIAFTELVLPIMNISDSIPVTKESMLNFSYLEGVIRKFLDVNMSLAEELEVYSGDGSAPNLTGVYTSATTFDPATMIAATNKVNDASLYDLVSYLTAYIASGKKSKYRADYCLINDLDFWKMLSKKDANDNYLVPPFVRIQGESIFVGGVQMIPTSLVTSNTLVIGDFRQGEYHADPNWTIELGWINTDFTQNRVTMLANKRAALLIKNLDVTAFYKVTDLSAAITGLTA